MTPKARKDWFRRQSWTAFDSRRSSSGGAPRRKMRRLPKVSRLMVKVHPVRLDAFDSRRLHHAPRRSRRGIVTQA